MVNNEEEYEEEEMAMADLEGLLTEAYMGATEGGSGFYYAGNEDGSLTIILIANPDTLETASFVGPVEQTGENQLTLTDETSDMTLTYSIEEVEDGYVLDMGDIGLAIIGPCEVSEVLEAMQIINDNGIPVM